MTHPFRILHPAGADPSSHESPLAANESGREFANRCAFAVMSKAPVPGKVKTRLSPPLTPTEAAALNAEFLRDTLVNLGAAAEVCNAAPVVSYTPVGEEDAFAGILPPGTLLVPQHGGDFGERLLHTAEDLFRCGFHAVCLIDSDSPTVPTEEFVRAAETLLPAPGTSHDGVILGRSDDGGYYLLGMTRPHANLFARITWSTERVAAETAERAAELHLPLTHLRTWYDVDDRHSLERLRREMAGDADVPVGYPAPHTRGFLQTLDEDARESSLPGGGSAYGLR